MCVRACGYFSLFFAMFLETEPERHGLCRLADQ